MFCRCFLPSPFQICIPDTEDRKRLPSHSPKRGSGPFKNCLWGGSPSHRAAEPSPLNSFLSGGLIHSPLSCPQIEPKRLKKQLPKILKLLRPNDRILIVGTTRRPFDAELQSFCRVYQKIILVPRPDYASRYGKYPWAPNPGCRALWGRGLALVTRSAPGDVTAAARTPGRRPGPAPRPGHRAARAERTPLFRGQHTPSPETEGN